MQRRTVSGPIDGFARQRAQNQQFLSTLENMYTEKAKADSDWAMQTFQRDYMVKLGAERRRQRHEIDLETQKQEAAMARTEAQETGATERTQMGIKGRATELATGEKMDIA